MIGIILGSITCNYLYMNRMNWFYVKPNQLQDHACQSKVVTFVNKFKPNVWTRYDWSVFQNLTRYNQILFYCFFCLGVDCMNFFLKFILWVPADHKLLTFRLIFWACISLACSKEFYEFITNKNCKRVGPFLWMGCFTLGIEFSIAVKHGHLMFHAPFPWYVQLMWLIIGALILAGQAYSYYNQVRHVKAPEKPFDLLDPTIDIEPVFAKKNN
jgi:phosphatidylserine synthase 2